MPIGGAHMRRLPTSCPLSMVVPFVLSSHALPIHIAVLLLGGVKHVLSGTLNFNMKQAVVWPGPVGKVVGPTHVWSTESLCHIV